MVFHSSSEICIETFIRQHTFIVTPKNETWNLSWVMTIPNTHTDIFKERPTNGRKKKRKWWKATALQPCVSIRIRYETTTHITAMFCTVCAFLAFFTIYLLLRGRIRILSCILGILRQWKTEIHFIRVSLY